MDKFNIASFVKLLKKHTFNKTVSDEEFTNRLFETIIMPEKIEDRYGQELHLDKARVSKLLSNKADAPKVIQKALDRYKVEERILAEFETFVNECIECNDLNNLSDELSKLIMNDSDLGEGVKNAIITQKGDLYKFLTTAFIEAIKINNKTVRNKSDVIWQNGENHICVTEGDLFSYGFKNRSKTKKNIVVIPVNTAFDTHVTTTLENEIYPLVSENTIHGKWLLNWKKGGRTIDELDTIIKKEFARQGKKPIKKASSLNGKKECYNIGTIATVECENAFFYLLAISEFNDKNNAKSTEKHISEALTKLLEYYDELGQGYKMYLPLVGTGRSRTNLSYQESFNLLTKTFVSNKGKIHGSITIVAEPNVMKNIDLKGEIL